VLHPALSPQERPTKVSSWSQGIYVRNKQLESIRKKSKELLALPGASSLSGGVGNQVPSLLDSKVAAHTRLPFTLELWVPD